MIPKKAVCILMSSASTSRYEWYTAKCSNTISDDKLDYYHLYVFILIISNTFVIHVVNFLTSYDLCVNIKDYNFQF